MELQNMLERAVPISKPSFWDSLTETQQEDLALLSTAYTYLLPPELHASFDKQARVRDILDRFYQKVTRRSYDHGTLLPNEVTAVLQLHGVFNGRIHARIQEVYRRPDFLGLRGDNMLRIYAAIGDHARELFDLYLAWPRKGDGINPRLQSVMNRMEDR